MDSMERQVVAAEIPFGVAHIQLQIDCLIWGRMQNSFPSERLEGPRSRRRSPLGFLIASLRRFAGPSRSSGCAWATARISSSRRRCESARLPRSPPSFIMSPRLAGCSQMQTFTISRLTRRQVSVPAIALLSSRCQAVHPTAWAGAKGAGTA